MSANWPLVPLGEVLQRRQDFIDLHPTTDYRELTVKLWGKGVVLRRVVPGSAIAGTRRSVAKAGQFILSRIDARNGAFGIIPDQLDGSIVSNDFPVFSPNASRLLTEYLDWMSKTKAFIELCQRASEGTTNRVRLQETRFLAMQVTLPSLDEQRRIVARIEGLSSKILEASTLRQESGAATDALAPSSCEEVFRRLAGKHGTRRLSALCDSITDGDHNTPAFEKEGVRFIFVGNVSSGVLHFDNAKRVSLNYFQALRQHRVPRRGDILYTAVGATLGIPALVETDEPFCFQRHVAILKPNRDRVDARFLYFMLKSRTAFGRAWDSTTGSAQPTVPLRAIRDLEVPLPSSHEQQRVTNELQRLFAQAEELRTAQLGSSAGLDALMPAILDRAFRGEPWV